MHPNKNIRFFKVKQLGIKYSHSMEKLTCEHEKFWKEIWG